MTAVGGPRYAVPSIVLPPNPRLKVLLAACALLVALRAQADTPELKAEANQSHTLGGFDLDLTFWAVSGLDAAPGAYETQGVLIFEPRFNIGQRYFRHRWAEPLTLGARLLVEAELTGNDETFRNSTFASPALLRDSPEAVDIAEATGATNIPYGNGGGAGQRVALTDLWLTLTHGKVATIPRLKIDVEAGTRVVLPTSLESQVAGFVAAPSLMVGLKRKWWRFDFEYAFRGTKYFFTSTVGPVGAYGGTPTVQVNGQAVTPLHFASTGKLNPDFGFAHYFAIGFDLPRNFSLEAIYYLMNSFTYALGDCTVPGVPTANVCTAGRAIGDVRSPAERDKQWFLVEVDWKPASWGTIGVGLSTFQPLRQYDGSLANPVLRVTRDNYSTVYLSLALNAEALATALKQRRKN